MNTTLNSQDVLESPIGQTEQKYEEPHMEIIRFDDVSILADSSRCCGWYGMVSHAD